MSETVMKIQDLKKTYADGTTALKSISFEVKKGEFIAVIGPSGAGKSTLLRSINMLNKPTDGSIQFMDYNMTKLNGRSLRKARRNIGMIFQGFNLVQRSTALQNVLHGRLGYVSSVKGSMGLFSKEEKDRALSILVRVGLEDQALKKINELSGGQQQRVGIARSIAQDPSLVLADEPIASLDPQASENVMNYLKKICDEDGITTIVNLHQVDYAKSYADRIIGVRSGEVVFDGRPKELTDGIVRKLYY